MKYSRHAKILELIEKYHIETQEELAEKLKEHGMDVTQATVSRDIKELRLIKVMSDNGSYRYASISPNESNISNKLLRVFAESFVSCDYANNLLVVKTLPGMAQAAASAVDSLKWADIVGTIAGDDTIMIVCRTEKIAEELVGRFNRMIR
ncbi:MAG: arginine repressor [Acetivibrionales bacterium]|jgi:transcriptional regulator of arginine metabolism|nr:arginine repressor [Bacillota bacterium]NLP06810.1 arginine repressor [Clostridiaceae bacterium]HOA55953.1 arginine repressor [Clostridiales bacterium]HPZ04528.1 arginine repressor [Clostridiales bacterium]HQD30654.1 arginine repressor [Clostridiales bacterium]